MLQNQTSFYLTNTGKKCCYDDDYLINYYSSKKYTDLECQSKCIQYGAECEVFVISKDDDTFYCEL